MLPNATKQYFTNTLVSARSFLHPKNYKLSGFTLIELMVVIAIIAILAVVGFAIFTGTQSRARDSKRTQDISSMSKAMEVNNIPGSGYKTSVDPAWFADGAIPKYPNPPAGSYVTGTPTTAGFMFCAALENSAGNAISSTGTSLGTTGGAWFCKRNSQ